MHARVLAWPCDYQRTWDELLSFGVADCGPLCEQKPIAVSSRGEAECSILIDQPDLGRCDPERGWRDPGGEATFVDHGMEMRRCEIVQLAGADLDRWWAVNGWHAVGKGAP